MSLQENAQTIMQRVKKPVEPLALWVRNARTRYRIL